MANKPLITIRDLRKSFPTPAGELTILKGLSAEFFQGEMVSIVGASGTGKSTFLHIIGTLDSPTAGTVAYHLEDSLPEGVAPGTDQGMNPFLLDEARIAAFRNRVIGFVFQFHYLLPEFTAIENVLMPGLIGRHGRSAGELQVLKKRAEGLLDELGLAGRKDHKPGELSGGEQQRVAVARALLQEPRVVLADEPTGNLDTATGEDLFRVLTEINASRGVTFIIVTHNPSLSRRCGRTLEMADGKLSPA